MFDNHCHLTIDLFDKDREAVIARARQSLGAVLSVGTRQSDSEKVLALAKAHKGFVFPVLGLCQDHILDAELKSELAFLKAHASEMVALGETGLEYHHYGEEHWLRLREFFRAQLELAEELRLPVHVHIRKAHEDAFAILKDFPKLTVVLHCFYEDKWMQEALARGYYLSIPTLKNKARDKIIRQAPLNRLFAETDSPFLWQGGRNEPANVAEVYTRMGEKRGISVQEVEKSLSVNAEKVYRLAERGAKGF